MKNRITTLCLFILAFFRLSSQSATARFHINNINALVLNGGDLFNEAVITPGFEVPAGSGKSPIFAAGLWIGGLDQNNKLHLSASTYRQDENHFIPGPVSNYEYLGKTTRYDKVFIISQAEIDYHRQHYSDKGYSAASSILTWPGNGNPEKGEAQRLAPFADLNRNNIYEPLLGEYPLIPGDACAFTIFNDCTPHDSLRIEVHQFIYGYDAPGTVMNNTLFVSYRIYNRSELRLHDTYISRWADFDFGSSNYFLNDSLRNLFIACNNTDDSTNTNGYQAEPAVLGSVYLNKKLWQTTYYSNDPGPNGNPSTASDYYKAMQGLNKFGYPHFPYKFPDIKSKGYSGYRTINTLAPFFFPPGGSYCFTMAYIYASAYNGGTDASVKLLKESADFVRKYFNNRWVDDACDAYAISGIAEKYKVNTFSIYPNPASEHIILETGHEYLGQYFTVVNYLEQAVISGVITESSTRISLSGIPPGAYFIRSGAQSLRFVRTE
jgi:hypothetical protein